MGNDQDRVGNIDYFRHCTTLSDATKERAPVRATRRDSHAARSCRSPRAEGQIERRQHDRLHCTGADRSPERMPRDLVVRLCPEVRACRVPSRDSAATLACEHAHTWRNWRWNTRWRPGTGCSSNRKARRRSVMYIYRPSIRWPVSTSSTARALEVGRSRRDAMTSAGQKTMPYVMAGTKLHADDTPVPVLESRNG